MLFAPWIKGGTGGAVDDTAPGLSHVLSLSEGNREQYDFAHLPYVNPRAPKGGVLRLHAVGTFDSMNPFTSLGTLPAGRGLTTDSLMFGHPNDVYTLYPLLAEGYILNRGESWIEFHLHPKARFHDGTAVTASDVIFSYEGSMQNLGHGIQQFFKDILGVEARGERSVRFNLRKNFDENVLAYIAVLHVQSRAFWEGKDISREYLGRVPGSGPYTLESYEQGKSVVYKRVENYWGRDLPVSVGRHNFAEIRYEYFRDSSVAFEAFLAGHYDYRRETNLKRWEHQYKGRLVEGGAIAREEFPDGATFGMRGLFFNLRRPLFQDREVRRALLLAFDFEWGNKVFFNGKQRRVQSYFSNSPYQAPPLPGGAEKALLLPFARHLPEKIFDTAYTLPASDGRGFNRANLVEAQRLMETKGFFFKNGALHDPITQEPVIFEITTRDAGVKKVVEPFVQNLARLGIRAGIRVVDGPNFVRRLEKFDYDLLETGFGFPRKLGREQWLYWHSANSGVLNGYNRVGANHPALDFLTERIAAENDPARRIAAANALDRVLLWENYAIPFAVDASERVAYYRKIRPPRPLTEINTLDIHSWWEVP